ESRPAIATYLQAAAIVNGREVQGAARQVCNPANRNDAIGTIVNADEQAVDEAMAAAYAAQPKWNALSGDARAQILERAADLFEKNRGELMALRAREAGKSVPDTVAELREAVDFLRYSAVRARHEFTGGVALPGPTGESNELRLEGRGVF